MKWRRMRRLRDISTAVFPMLVILSLTLTGSEGTRGSIKNLEETGSSKDKKSPNTEPNSKSSSSSTSTGDNSPALNSFLKNVLRAQDELKWIDQAVRRVGTKGTRENMRNRYIRTPGASRRYHSNIRSKRKSGSQSDEEESWPSSKRGYYEEDETENLEDETRGYPSRDFDDDEGYRESRRKHERSSLVDDATLTHWAQSEGLDVPSEWLDPVHNSQESDEEDEGVEGSPDDWFGNLRDERDARVEPAIRKEPEEPTFESLKKTVLELRKSLEDSDKKMDALTEKQGDPGVAKDRERHVEDISERKESRTKGQHERAMPTFDGTRNSPKNPEIYSGSSNWWDDSRPAAEMFDFKRRDEDAMDDEDDDEDSEPGISEFDYMMQRVKRDEYKDWNEGEGEGEGKVRVYRRAGFGGSYPEDHDERSRTSRVYREIREAGSDGDNNEGNSNDVEGRKRGDINSNENGHSSSGVEEIKKLLKSEDAEKNVADDNPLEKSGHIENSQEKVAVNVAAGDSNKNENIGGDEKRSSLKERKEEPEQGLLPDEAPENMIELKLDSLLKNAPKAEPTIEKKSTEKESGGVEYEGKSMEVEKSESNDDSDVHKLSKESGNDEVVKQENFQSSKRDEDSKLVADKISEKVEKGAEKSEDAKIAKLDDPEKSSCENGETKTIDVGGMKASNSVDDKNETGISSGDNGEKLSRERSSDEERKYNKQEESYDEDKRLIGYSDKDNAKYHERGDNEAAKLAKDEKRQDPESFVQDKNSEESGQQVSAVNRKLLWLSDKSVKGGSKIVEIRDGRRDSSWDQNHGEKSGQRPANYLRNPSADEGLEENAKFAKRSLMVADDEEALNRLKKREETRSSKKDSVPEEPDDDSGRLDKRSLEKNVDRQKESGVNDEEAYEIEGDDVAQDEEGDDNLQADQERDRDPMRDRINMLIKQKLDDRGKGKLVHLKREVNNIQYYDYDSDVNGVNSEADSTVVANDQQQQGSESNSTYPQVAIDKAPPEMIKTDEQAEEEMKEKLEQENQKNKEPKQEFISDVELSKAQKKKPPSEDQDDKDFSRQDNPAAGSNSRWLGQPEEADPETEQDSKDLSDGRSEESREPEEADKPENENGEILGEPLEYSVNVHGKLDPESIGGILTEKETDRKDKEIEENENRSDKLEMGTDDDWKYEGIRGSSRSQDQEVERDLEPADQKLSDRNWRYRGDSARIEEENKGRKFYSKNTDEEDEDVRSSREAREFDDSNQDSLPTMLDRSSGSREQLAPGERTYLVIAPNEVKQPVENSSSSSSRSNYLALKVTDDMFKGGIEQSNPTDDKTGETNSMGRTTTEWRVIKPQDRDDSNSEYDEEPIRQNILMNPRDVAHESFVDREEIVGDFDDDARPRFRRDLKYVQGSLNRHFGRNLQSVSYPKDPFGVVDLNENEKPLEKYLENTQKMFEYSETKRKRNATSVENSIDKEKKEVDKKNPVITNNFTENKNSTEIPNGNNDNDNNNEIDKDKRGLTNVEEWEMDAPSVQKQQLKKYAKKNADIGKSEESHDREIRSLKPDNFKPTLNRSKNRQRLKSRDKFLPLSSRANPFAKYVSSWDSNQPDNYGGVNVKKDREDNYENQYWPANREHRKSVHENKSNNRHYRQEGLKKRRGKISRSNKSASHENRESKRRSKNSKRHRSPVARRAKTMANPLGKKSFQTAIDEKKVSDENDDKPTTGRNEGQKKKFTVLLAADNMEDESQMDLALHGELAGKIVERIYDQVQKNDALKVSLGPGLFRKHKSEDAVASDKIYREELDEDEVQHTEGMMRRVMELLGRLILDEVQRKTCASLPPDMREFLQWMLGVDNDNRPTDQVPQTFDNNQDPNHSRGDEFLFEDPSMNNEIADLSELNKKVRVLRKLIDEYSSLSTKEKTKVQTVHDYLVRQLGLLAKYIEAKEAQGHTAGSASTSTANISQSQNSIPNSTETTFYQSTMSPLVGTPSILMLSNASFIEHPANEPSNHLVRSGRRDTRSSEGDVAEKKRKRRHKHRHKHKHPHSKKHKHKKHKNKKKKRKKKKHHKRRSQSPEYKKLIRRAAMLRKKRANIYGDDWNPMDSGYEEPTIYTSTGKLTNKRRRSISKKGGSFLEKRETGDDVEPRLNSKSTDLSSPVNSVGRNIADDEVILLSKRDAWKSENEQQLEEVAFGKDMRGKWKEKEEFEKLTEIDRKKNPDDGVGRKKREDDGKKSDGQKVDGDQIGETLKSKNEIPAEGSKEDKSHIVENMEGKSSEQNEESEKKRSLGVITPGVEGSAILPLLEVSEQRQEQKQASKTEKDDQRDIADQMLGFVSPSMTGLNTY